MSAHVIARASVRVPASTANLGAGFDCIGVAIDKWLRVSAELRNDTSDDQGLVTFHRTGTLRELDRAGLSEPREDLIWKGFNEVQRGRGGFSGSLHFEASSDIPIGKGLGSSAAALLAGAALANATLGLGLGADELAQVCARLEGHGDNVGAAAFGGAVLVAPGARGHCFSPLPVHEGLGFAFAVPEFETRTDRARAALPANVPFATAVSAAARSASLVRGLHTADAALLAAGLGDVLHVPTRKSLVPHYDLVVDAALSAGAFGATLSGSGSSILAVVPRPAGPSVAAAMAEAWRDAGVETRAFSTGVCQAGLTVVSPTNRATDLPTHGSAQPIHLPRSIACP